MIEFELKFQIPIDRREAVRAFVGGRKRPAPQPIRLTASYFDTADRSLARAGIALRVRRQDAGWVQTLKGVAADGIGREEYELPLPDAPRDGNPPLVDPRRHRGVPLGDRLLDLLADSAQDGLCCCYSSDIQRLRRHLKTRYGTVELAFDEGHLASGGRRLAVCELEIELLSGHPLAVIDVARRWALRFGLWLDTRSKAERGDLLARGLSVAPPQSDISPPKLHEQHAPRVAQQAALAAVRQPILANASQIASGDFDAEHLHQLRVMLRRLRVYLRLFADDPGAADLARPLAGPAADLFRALGAGRDQSVLAGPLAQRIGAALREAGVDGEIDLAGRDDIGATMPGLLRSMASQRLLLDLIEATLPAFVDTHGPGNDGPASDAGRRSSDPVRLRGLLLRRLSRWRRSITRDAGRFDELDAAARHLLRKRVKRLRYAIEATSGLFGQRDSKAIAKPLQRAQQVLGDINDLATAIQAIGAAQADDRRAWFARGWLIAQQQALLANSARPMARLARAMRRKRLR